jgi:galactose mutarotase-like enzyme
MSIYVLSNDKVRAIIDKSGAELQSFENLKTGLEYIWQADPEVWGRHAPHLFPIVGKLKDNFYYYKGKRFEMGQHGFARDCNFECSNNDNTSVALYLESSEKSKEIYPFDFRLEVNYHLEDTTLHITYSVFNISHEDIYFSIGGHPGFTCPLLHGEKFSDYFLQFQQNETKSRHLLKGGLFNDNEEPVMEDTHILHLDYDLFQKDAIVFKGLKSDYVYLKSLKGSHGVKFDFQGFPYLGIWTKNDRSRFICIEPWFGLADNINSSQNIEDKEGVIKLAPRQKFECKYSMTIF